MITIASLLGFLAAGEAVPALLAMLPWFRRAKVATAVLSSDELAKIVTAVHTHLTQPLTPEQQAIVKKDRAKTRSTLGSSME
jgi:hypothetical protein